MIKQNTTKNKKSKTNTSTSKPRGKHEYLLCRRNPQKPNTWIVDASKTYLSPKKAFADAMDYFGAQTNRHVKRHTFDEYLSMTEFLRQDTGWSIDQMLDYDGLIKEYFEDGSIIYYIYPFSGDKLECFVCENKLKMNYGYILSLLTDDARSITTMAKAKNRKGYTIINGTEKK